MKNYIQALFCLSLLVIVIFLFNQPKSSIIPAHDRDDLENESERQDGMLRAWKQEFLMTRDPQLNKIPVDRLITARQRMEELNVDNSRTTSTTSVQALAWQERGPNNIAGRTRALLVDRSDATGNTVYAAGVGGGLWKTTNFKTTCTWTVVDDFFANIAITCIKQSPTNALEMYFGTGEGYNNFDAIDGLGIWKSTNGGTSWTQLSSTTGLSYVNDLEFDNNGYIYATTRSTDSTLRGVLRSTNGGTSWTQVLTDPTAGVITRGSDLEKAANGDMYATIGLFTGGHIFRSAVNGVNTGISGSWTEITPGAIGTNQRIELAVCPSNSSRIYAVSQASAGGIGNLFRSDNSGGSWTTLPAASWCDQGAATNSDFSRGQAWYDLIMAVDPNNADNIYVGGVVMVKSTNAGAAWTQATRWTSGASCTTAPVIHADIHEIQFLNSTEMIVCTDGGIFYSSNTGTSFTAKNTGYRVTQYYGMAIHPTAGSNYMLAGAQDNGTHSFSSPGINTVSTATGGDGGFCFINQTNANYQITSFPGLDYARSNNGGTSFTQGPSLNSNVTRFINPAALDNTANNLYFAALDGEYGHYDVAAGGGAYTTIDLTANPSSLALTNLQVSAVKVDADTTNTIWLGFSTAEDASASVAPCLVKVIKADGPSAGPMGSKPVGTKYNLPGGIAAGSYISSIDIESGNRSHMLITISNYGVSSVWESTNAGVNWTSLDNNGVNLPDMPIRWGMFIPSGYTARTDAVGGIMLATELGVWSTNSINGASTVWAANNSGLANVRTDQIVLRNSDKVVAAATHGRGVFTTTLLSSPLPVTLIDFNGYLGNKLINLEWSTASELNSKHFEIEKSYNGTDYFKIGVMNAAGNSSSTLTYRFTDLKPVEFNYYRLKMVDLDDHFIYSKSILIKNPSIQQDLQILNNPFESFIKLRFTKQPKSKIHVQLISENGSKVLDRQLTATYELTIDLSSIHLSRGAYFLRADVDGELYVRKLIKN